MLERRAATVLFAASLALAGCSSGNSRPSPSATPQSPSASPTATPDAPPPVSSGPSSGSSSAPSAKSGGATGPNLASTGTELPDPVKASAPFRPDPPDVLPVRAEKMPGYAQVRSMPAASLGPTEVALGGKLWKQNCAPCHGMDGTGNPKFPTASGPDLRRAYLYKYGSGAKAIYRTIEFGIPRTPMGMLKGQMTSSEIWALVAYTQSLIQGVELKAEIKNP